MNEQLEDLSKNEIVLTFLEPKRNSWNYFSTFLLAKEDAQRTLEKVSWVALIII